MNGDSSPIYGFALRLIPCRCTAAHGLNTTLQPNRFIVIQYCSAQYVQPMFLCYLRLHLQVDIVHTTQLYAINNSPTTALHPNDLGSMGYHNPRGSKQHSSRARTYSDEVTRNSREALR